MEFEEYKQEEPSEEDYVEIYSKRAIIGFSVFFNVIFGGAFLVINMFNAGYKKEIGRVIGFSFFYYFLSMYLLALSGIRIDPKILDMLAKSQQVSNADKMQLALVVVLTLSINFIGGLILTQYFYKKYFPEDDYYPKPVGRAIVICLFVSFIFSFLLKGMLHF
jgi:uncharacterized membrane protein